MTTQYSHNIKKSLKKKSFPPGKTIFTIDDIAMYPNIDTNVIILAMVGLF